MPLKPNSGRNPDMAAKSSLTILFEPPFWIGLYERIDGGNYEICKITFGAEPKDYEVYAFLLQNWKHLQFSPPVKADKSADRQRNPKRVQREISNQLQAKGIGTKAQQALKRQQEQNKADRKARHSARKEAEAGRQFALRQEKKKAKHRGH